MNLLTLCGNAVRNRAIVAVLLLLAAPAAMAQTQGTVNLVGPSTTPGAPQITPATINAAVNAALAAKADANHGVLTSPTIVGGCTGCGGSPAGPTGYLQYNDSGAFGGAAPFGNSGVNTVIQTNSIGVAGPSTVPLDPTAPQIARVNGANAQSYMQQRNQVFPAIDGLPIGSTGQTGTPQAGMILAGGDDFTSQALSIACSNTPLGRYFDTRSYQIFGEANQGARTGTGVGGSLAMYDIGPCHTGYQDAGNGVVQTGWSDMLTQSGGVLRLKARIAQPAEIGTTYALQPTLGSMITTAGFLAGKPPFVFDALVRTGQGLNTRGSGWHPSLPWFKQTGGINLDTNTLLGGVATCDDNEFDPWEIGINTFYNWNFNAGACPGTPTAITPNLFTQHPGMTFDASWHRITVMETATGFTYWWDGSLVWPLSQDITAHGDRLTYFLFSNHVISTSFSNTNWTNYGPSGAIVEVKEWRLWIPSTAQIWTPQVQQPDINIDWGASWPVAFTLPSKATVWGSNSVVDSLEAIPHEANGPDANYNGSWWGVPCVATGPNAVTGCQDTTPGFSTVLNGNGTVTVTLQKPDNPGRFYMVRWGYPSGFTTGGATYPQRFAINIGPTFTSPGTLYGRSGFRWEFQAYRDCNSGDLSKYVALSSSITSGWSWKIPRTGQIPTNGYRNGGRVDSNLPGLIASTPFTLTCSNDPGQSVSQTFTAAQYTNGQAIPAPVVPGETPIGSLDFGNLSSLTLAGSSITAAAGVDGTASGAVQATGGAQPTSTLAASLWPVRSTTNIGNATIGSMSASGGIVSGSYNLVATSSTQWSVTDPTGTSLPAATEGVAYSNSGLAFTITTGSVPTTIGDTYNINYITTYGATFNGSSSYMDWSSLLSAAPTALTSTTAGYTIVLVAATPSPNQQATLLDVSQGSAGATTNRASVLITNSCGSGGNNAYLMRSGATTADVCYAPTPVLTSVPQLIIARRAIGATADLELVVDTTQGVFPGYGSPTTATVPALLDTVLLGARKTSGTVGSFFNGILYRVIIYPTFMSDAELQTIMIWFANFYGGVQP